MSIDLWHRISDKSNSKINVVTLHGLLASLYNWQVVIKRLATRFKFFNLDLRNHGKSPFTESMTYEELADDVKRFITQHNLNPVYLLGHSMGGKAAMTLAINHPDIIDGIIIEDIAPTPYQMRFDDVLDAMLSIDLPQMSSRDEIDNKLSLGIPDDNLRGFVMTNLASSTEGFIWRCNVKSLRENLLNICDFPDLKPKSYTKPALFIRGGGSDYVAEQFHSDIESYFPNSNITEISDAGHWVHSQFPDEFSQKVESFIQENS